ncbi:MAG: glycine-rich domain-containing protein [Acidobacteriaceae bacterium]
MASLVGPQFHGSQTFTANGTFTVPDNVGQITVTAVGGGGSGAASTGASSASTPLYPGGAGGICIKTFDVVSGQQYTVTIGAGGAYVSLGTTLTGNPGGATTFSGNGVSMSAAGGLGGLATSDNFTFVQSTGGDYNTQSGHPVSTYVGGTSQPGESSLFGVGGASKSGADVSGVGGGIGAGGGALSSGSTSWGSGPGGSGQVVVEW